MFFYGSCLLICPKIDHPPIIVVVGVGCAPKYRNQCRLLIGLWIDAKCTHTTPSNRTAQYSPANGLFISVPHDDHAFIPGLRCYAGGQFNLVGTEIQNIVSFTLIRYKDGKLIKGMEKMNIQWIFNLIRTRSTILFFHKITKRYQLNIPIVTLINLKWCHIYLQPILTTHHCSNIQRN